MKKKLVAALIVGAIVSALAIPTFVSAGKPTRSYIEVPDGVFASTTTATVHSDPNMWVYAACYQNGELVYAQYVRADDNNQAVLTLGPTPRWTAGSADCTAEEGYWGKAGRWRTVASTTFHVDG